MSGITVTIRRAALPAWQRLQDALRSSPPTPCAGDDRWTSESPEVREWAAGHCAGCPALAACAAFAISNRETAGVWAGIDMGDRVAVRRATTEVKEQTA